MASELKLGSGQTARFKEVEHPTIYSNMMGVGATPFDIAVTFAEVEKGTPEEVIGVPRVKILLAPEQASNLLIMLKAVLDQYTAGNGPLRESGRVNVQEFTAAAELASRKVAKPQ
jgi:uncharacterized protein DUF3467